MRKKLKALLIVVCAASLHTQLRAQYYYYNDRYYDNAVVFELGASGGIMNCLTDLGGNKGIGKKFIKDLNWKNTRPSFGVYLLANYEDKLALRLEGTFGEVMAYDSILKDVAATTTGRYERNLSFKSRISEVQLALEVHPLMFRKFDDDDPPRFSPYAIAGAGYFSFDPKAKLGGTWYSLQPLRLEGQGFKEYPDRKPYKLNQINIVSGIGVKYQISPMFNARLEFVHRTLFTDYLDDVSLDSYIDPSLFNNYLTPAQAAVAQQLYQRKSEITPEEPATSINERGDPKNNDSYFSFQFKLGMILGRQRR
ncbi:MAG TPA: DUF6089 family protein [Chitinophagaceae bacterium]|jgi:hypothetical protein|nr:DUF6089 family protein [Chitinophagaceae bacterium]HMU56991.1 DUF6089 family protein [Chitinophagaceae bacterium]